MGVLKLWKDLIEPVNDLVDSSVSCDTSESLVSIVEDAHDLGVTGSDFASTQETPGELELQKFSMQSILCLAFLLIAYPFFSR